MTRLGVVLACVWCSVAMGQEPMSAAAALDALVAYKVDAKQAPDEATIRAAAVLAEAVKDPKKIDDGLRVRIEALVAMRGEKLFPSSARPVTTRDPLARALVAYESRRVANLPVGEVRAMQVEFPGDVPAGAKEILLSTDIDCSTPGRASLGLYAAAGALVTVRVEAGAVKAGLKVRIGAHSDNISRRDSWPRMPEITRVFPITTEVTRAACAYGGVVYVEVPSGCTLGRTRVVVGGAVEAPRFVLGSTELESWRAIRHAPGPWAEFETRKVILTIPSDLIRTLDDPRPVLEFWNRVLDAAADLAVIPRDRKRPERYVADVEISAGYMHSGYPIMTHLDAAKAIVDVEAMKKGQWGLFHELGHNHQQKEWTFSGTTEVTCNLFSMYIIEEVCGKPKGSGHDALAKARERVAAMMKDGRKPWAFEPRPDDKNTRAGDPFTRLIMYRELIDAFGWEPFKRVFAEYRALPEGERPKSEDEKRDQWMVRMSRTVGKNLGPFFEMWGVPVSAGAVESVAALPRWLPEP